MYIIALRYTFRLFEHLLRKIAFLLEKKCVNLFAKYADFSAHPCFYPALWSIESAVSSRVRKTTRRYSSLRNFLRSTHPPPLFSHGEKRTGARLYIPNRRVGAEFRANTSFGSSARLYRIPGDTVTERSKFIELTNTRPPDK